MLSVLDPLGIEHAAQDVVAHAREILHAPAADHHHGMLLKVMALARNVADHLEAVGQPHLGDLAQRRIRLLRGRGVHPGANAALLRRSLQRRHLVAALLPHSRLADQLGDRRHRVPHPISRTRVRPRLAPTWFAQNETAPSGPGRNGAYASTEDRDAATARSCTRSLTKLSEAASEFLGSRRLRRRADGETHRLPLKVRGLYRPHAGVSRPGNYEVPDACGHRIAFSASAARRGSRGPRKGSAPGEDTLTDL